LHFSEEQHEDAINGFTRQSSSSETDSDVEMRTLKLTGGDDELDDENEGLQMHIQDVTLSALADESNEAICGEYSNYYDTFQLIGNGTFGSVKLAARKDSGLLVSNSYLSPMLIRRLLGCHQVCLQGEIVARVVGQKQQTSKPNGAD
jgi:hypothetical protein